MLEIGIAFSLFFYFPKTKQDVSGVSSPPISGYKVRFPRKFRDNCYGNGSNNLAETESQLPIEE